MDGMSTPSTPTTSTAPGTACPDCGAEWDTVTCTGLYHELLALDHARVQPFGRFHGLNVACYLLQHPAAVPEGQRRHLGALWEMVTVYLSGGIGALHHFERCRVAGTDPRMNPGMDPGMTSGVSGGVSAGLATGPATGAAAGTPALPPRVRMSPITIRDVAVVSPGSAGSTGSTRSAGPGESAGPGVARHFPAAGFEDRMHLWALAIAAERGLHQ